MSFAAGGGEKYEIRTPKHPNKETTMIVMNHDIEVNQVTPKIASEISKNIAKSIGSALPLTMLKEVAVQLTGLCMNNLPDQDKQKFTEFMIKTLDYMRTKGQPAESPAPLKVWENSTVQGFDPDSIEGWKHLKDHKGGKSDA